jgi:bifunctional DNA-binding transcriptional regulator/antitoxin component of YhaV-PrlF toxin-antitoxin module
MTIKTTQKVIKIGDSLGITIPAKDARAAGIDKGEEVEVILKPVEKPKLKPIEKEYDEFKKKYGQTLKNLSDR